LTTISGRISVPSSLSKALPNGFAPDLFSVRTCVLPTLNALNVNTPNVPLPPELSAVPVPPARTSPLALTSPMLRLSGTNVAKLPAACDTNSSFVPSNFNNSPQLANGGALSNCTVTVNVPPTDGVVLLATSVIVGTAGSDTTIVTDALAESAPSETVTVAV